MADRVVLGLDTSTKWLNLALVEEGCVLGEVHERVETHTTRLVPALDALLARTGRSRTALAAIGVVVGPGSFTGLRVGLAAAEGLSEALGAPAFGLDSLTALARTGGLPDGEGLALLDARRGQVYARRFLRRAGETVALGDPEAVAPSAIRATLNKGLRWAIGDGVPLIEGWPAGVRVLPEIPNCAVPAALAAEAAHRAGASGHLLAPVYVRPPDVREPERKEPGSRGAGEPEKIEPKSQRAREPERAKK